jgi:seryl-tRNA synthetase
MLDIKIIRQDPQMVKAAMRRRGKPMDDAIDNILTIDEERRTLTVRADTLKAEQNKASREIPAIKKAGGDVSEIMARMKGIAEEVGACDAQIAALETRQQEILYGIPNICHKSVPEGVDDTANMEIRRWGEPTRFAFDPKAHWEIGAALGLLDPERAAKVTGARFHFS